MKIQVILTILLLGFGLWAGFHCGEKARLDRIADQELREKLKSHHDSIFLSDIKYFYQDIQVTNTDSLAIRKIGPDSLALFSLNVYDNKGWRIELAKEKMDFQAYQDEKSYLDKFRKSAIHLVTNQTGDRFPKWDWYMDIFNSDTSSRICSLRFTFFRRQLQTVSATYKTKA